MSLSSLMDHLLLGKICETLTKVPKTNIYRYAIGNETMAEWLLQNGADPNAGFAYDTPLSRAAIAGSVRLLQLFLSFGGDVRRGQVLHWAIERQQECCEVVTMLLQQDAPSNILEFDGIFPVWTVLQHLGTPLHKAVRLNKLDVVDQLLKYGADPDMKDTSGRTARDIATELGRAGVISLIQDNER